MEISLVSTLTSRGATATLSNSESVYTPRPANGAMGNRASYAVGMGFYHFCGSAASNYNYDRRGLVVRGSAATQPAGGYGHVFYPQYATLPGFGGVPPASRNYSVNFVVDAEMTRAANPGTLAPTIFLTTTTGQEVKLGAATPWAFTLEKTYQWLMIKPQPVVSTNKLTFFEQYYALRLTNGADAEGLSQPTMAFHVRVDCVTVDQTTPTYKYLFYINNRPIAETVASATLAFPAIGWIDTYPAAAAFRIRDLFIATPTAPGDVAVPRLAAWETRPFQVNLDEENSWYRGIVSTFDEAASACYTEAASKYAQQSTTSGNWTTRASTMSWDFYSRAAQIAVVGTQGDGPRRMINPGVGQSPDDSVIRTPPASYYSQYNTPILRFSCVDQSSKATFKVVPMAFKRVPDSVLRSFSVTNYFDSTTKATVDGAVQPLTQGHTLRAFSFSTTIGDFKISHGASPPVVRLARTNPGGFIEWAANFEYRQKPVAPATGGDSPTSIGFMRLEHCASQDVAKAIGDTYTYSFPDRV